MRPIRLRMTAFGPFAGTEEVDFRRLGDRNLVLIEGPTGAGKTTLLDGISFALFGSVPGPRTEAREALRSDHASGTSVCSVELDFALGDRTFRVERSPPQSRARLRGEGRTRIDGQAHLFETTGGRDRAVCPSKVPGVNAAIAEILGLDVHQFMQVLLLPQGEFRRLLLARSEEKEKLLERLFATVLYRDVAEHLAGERSALEGQVDDAGRLRAEVLAQVGSGSSEELATAIAGRQDALAEKDREAQVLRAAAAAAQDRVARAREIHAAQEARAAARAELAALESERPEAARWAAALERAVRAAPLEPAQAREATAAGAAQRAREQVEERRGSMQRSAAELEKRQIAAAEVPAHEARRASLTAEEAELALLVDVEAREIGARKLAADTASAARDAAGLARDFAGALARCEAAILPLAASLSAAQAIAARGTDLAKEAQETAAVAARGAELASARARRQRAAAALEKARGEEAGAAQRAAGALAAVDEARRLREAGIAGELATALEPGHPCPVCGSAEHPAPAVAGSIPPTQGEVAVLAETAAREERRSSAARAAQAAGAAQVAELSDQVAALEAGLGAATAEAPEALAARAADARRQAEDAERAGGKAAKLAAQLLEERSRAAALGAESAAHGEAAAARRREAEGAGRELAELRARLSARLPAGTTLTRAREALRRQAGEAGLAIEALRAGLRDAESARQVSLQAVEKALVEAERLGKEAAAARSELAAAVQAAGFASVDEARAARLDAAGTEALGSKRAEFQRREAELLARLGALEESRTEGEVPDLAAAEADAGVAARAATEVDQAIGAATRELASLQAALQRSSELDAAEARSLEALTVVGRLAAALRGENPLKMSLQRFVLASRMEEVALAASEQLLRMSRGRYLLHRTDEVQHGNRPSGLDLEVEDRHTGVRRAVHTLSGGEMFLASLSLALGLANVVTRRAGGVRLDALFIDEGFGALDDDTLDQVMRVLEELQAGGRMVGVISHVPELRERIPTRIAVRKGPRGSTTELVV